ncbi:MAG: ABC transporter ATP-binding protein [Caldilineaceae bacterium]|nr:ABC transporter ATP-binding protein [Caldilineaceae bacterium]
MRPSVQLYTRLLTRYLRPQLRQTLLLLFVLCANILLQLINPLIMRRFLDSALAGGSMEFLTRLALLFIGVAAVQQITAVTSAVLAENVGWRATNALRRDLARHCMRLDLSFHQQHTPGEMIERIDGDINALTRFFAQLVVQLFGNGLLLIGVMIVLLREDMRVGAAIGVFVVITLLVLARLRHLAVPHWQRSREASARFFGFVEERLAGTEDIRASNARAFTLFRFHQLLLTFWQTTIRAELLGFSMINIAWFLFSVGDAIAFVVGASLYFSGALTIGTVYLIFHYTNLISQPIERIAQEFEQFQRAGAGIARIQELFATESRLAETPAASAGAVTPVGSEAAGPAEALSVEFKQVRFAYPTDAPPEEKRTGNASFALDDFQLRLEPNEVLGLLGRTGSGKTTLARLLVRLYDVDGGRVLVSGRDVRQWPLAQLRSQVGMVTQNVQLFQASIRDNLTFFDRTVPENRIREAIDELGLARWYASLGEGLDTQLQIGSGGLSAGEAQLVAFTRIFLRDPGVIVLDEASSRLDPATEAFLERAVTRLLTDRTGILIAHRLSTVQRADRILILENGRIQEQGARIALASDSASRYHRLMQLGIEELDR